MLSKFATPVALIIFPLFLGCHHAGFDSRSPGLPKDSSKAKDDNGGDNAKDGKSLNGLHLECGKNIAQRVTFHDNATESPSMQLTGEFCPSISGVLNVVYLVDFSRSMETADSLCKRFTAVKDSIQNLIAKKSAALSVNVSIISFSADAKIESELKPYGDFEKEFLNVQGAEKSLCQAVSWTNYEAAFLKAKEVLANAVGHSLVVLISDGLPTKSLNNPGDDDDKKYIHRNASSLAFESLSLAVKNLFFKIAYINLKADKKSEIPQHLVDLAGGDLENIRMINGSSELTTSTVAVTNNWLTLNSQSFQAELIGPNDKVMMPLTLLPDAKGRSNVWTFDSGVRPLFDTIQVRVTAQDKFGSSYEQLYMVPAAL